MILTQNYSKFTTGCYVKNQSYSQFSSCPSNICVCDHFLKEEHCNVLFINMLYAILYHLLLKYSCVTIKLQDTNISHSCYLPYQYVFTNLSLHSFILKWLIALIDQCVVDGSTPLLNSLKNL